MRVLIVEDEKRLAQALGQIMEEQRYQVDIVYDGQDGLDYALSGQYDIVVLDVMLPKKDGFEVVRQLREANQSVPVLMLTARDDVTDKVLGLDCGADDYMTKPFSPEELLARIRALSRRQGDVLLEDIHWADLTLKLSSRTLHCGAKSVSLGFKEFEVLKLLLANPNGIVSKEELLVKVWGRVSSGKMVSMYLPIMECSLVPMRYRSSPSILYIMASISVWDMTPSTTLPWIMKGGIQKVKPLLIIKSRA